MMEPIHYGKQNITDDDINCVIDCLKSDYITQGPYVDKFEKQFSEYVGSKYSISVSNGTAALHLSVLALNLKPGDKVITTPLTFSATANSIRYCGGEVVFSDIDPKTYLLDIDKLEDLINSSPKGTYKGIITVDFAGRPIDGQRVKKIAQNNKLWIIEDACHAPGGFFVDQEENLNKCGNGNYADLTVFSFHPVKHIAAGEGGMITTNNKKLYEKIFDLRTHGITKSKEKFKNNIAEILGIEKIPLWYMEMQELGYNYRLSDINASLGYSQLKNADFKLKRRREIAKIYNDFFSNKEYISNHSGLIEGHAYHLYVIEVNNRDALYEYLRKNNIFCQIHYLPVHLMPYYKDLGWRKGDFPVVESYIKKCISIPMYPELTNNQINFILEKINSFFINK